MIDTEDAPARRRGATGGQGSGFAGRTGIDALATDIGVVLLAAGVHAVIRGRSGAQRLERWGVDRWRRPRSYDGALFHDLHAWTRAPSGRLGRLHGPAPRPGASGRPGSRSAVGRRRNAVDLRDRRKD
jgi:hypothetical protein